MNPNESQPMQRKQGRRIFRPQPICYSIECARTAKRFVRCSLTGQCKQFRKQFRVHPEPSGRGER